MQYMLFSQILRLSPLTSSRKARQDIGLRQPGTGGEPHSVSFYRKSATTPIPYPSKPCVSRGSLERVTAAETCNSNRRGTAFGASRRWYAKTVAHRFRSGSRFGPARRMHLPLDTPFPYAFPGCAFTNRAAVCWSVTRVLIHFPRIAPRIAANFRLPPHTATDLGT